MMRDAKIEFGTLFVQDLIVSAVLDTEYAPPTTHADDFVVAYGRLIESRHLELHERLIQRQMQIVQRRTTRSFSLLSAVHEPPAAGYQTLHYDDRDGRRQQITFRIVLAEYCIDRPPIGRRVLELGSGATGLVPIICCRASAAGVCATDFSDVVLDRLGRNLILNKALDHVAIRKLDWTEPDFDVLMEARPDLVLCADTIYCPDLIIGQVRVIRRALELGAEMTLMASCLRQEATFALLIESLLGAGLVYRQIEADQIPIRFHHVQRPDHIHILAISLAPASDSSPS